MKAGTLVRLPDGRIGTICYHHLDGYGGVWDKQVFAFEEDLPEPEFMLRDEYPSATRECVGEDYTVLEEGESK